MRRIQHRVQPRLYIVVRNDLQGVATRPIAGGVEIAVAGIDVGPAAGRDVLDSRVILDRGGFGRVLSPAWASGVLDGAAGVGVEDAPGDELLDEHAR